MAALPGYNENKAPSADKGRYARREGKKEGLP